MDPSGLWLQQPPRRILECLQVLAAAGNVPKTVRGLENAISPLTFITRAVSPSLVLRELCGARPGGLQLSCARRWALRENASLKDKAEVVGIEKAIRHNAIFFETNVLRHHTTAIDSLYERVSFSDVPQFTSKASLVQFVADRCSPMRELEPSLVLGLLKNIGVVSLGQEGQDDVIYIGDEDAYYLESCCNSMIPTGAVAPGKAAPSKVAFDVWWKAVDFSDQVPEALILLQRFLQRLKELGSDCPKTEAALVAELQPLCKVVNFCDPSIVLKKMSFQTKKKLSAVVTCTVTMSPHGFCMEGEDEGSDGLLSCLKLRLLQNLRKRGSSLVWGEGLEQEAVSAAVQRAEEWLNRRGVRVGREEGMVSGEEEKMDTATAEREGEKVPSLRSLQQEFVNLCISQGRVEPSQVVQQLIEGGVISVTEDGVVEYHQPKGSTPSAEDCISQLIERERRELLGQDAKSASKKCPVGRKRGKQTQRRGRKSQRIHT